MLKNHMLRENTFEKLIEDVKRESQMKTLKLSGLGTMDPAQKILADLTSFSILQQTHIESMPEAVQEKLFSMVGFQRESGKSARVLLEAEKIEKPIHIPSGQRFQVGDLYYETNKDFTVRGNHLIGIFTKWEEELLDFSYVLDANYPMAAEVFTTHPQVGMELCLVTDEMVNTGEELIFYVKLAEEYGRNISEGKNIFAHIKWQIYTQRGFIDIRCKDATESFTISGELSFHMPKEEAIIYEGLPKKGYLIRGILSKAEYDIAPKIKKINGYLFEAWQKETKSVCFTYSGKKQSIDLFSNILEYGYIQVFCKESQEDGYHLYQKRTSLEEKGRFYSLERLGYGKYRISFEKGGFKPGKFENAIKIVMYDEEMMNDYEVGCIYGYDEQKITLPAGHIVKEGFSVIAEKMKDDGEKNYYFIRPDSTRKGEFRYTLNEKEGFIVIEDARDFIDSKIYLGGCTVTQGVKGNVREGCIFQPCGDITNVKFTNPVKAKGGCDSEDIAQVRQRLIWDLQKHHTAVEAKDYEELVKNTPALCIDKVKAVRDEKNNRILVTVKPRCNQDFPKLSETYRKAIGKQLEKVRLLTASVELCQPVYVPVDISGMIYIRANVEDCGKQIEKVIRQQLDYVSTEKNFGERFYFDTLLEKLEALEDVKYIYNLSVSLPEKSDSVQQEGFDILPMDHCLLYPGKIDIVLKTTE